MGLDMYLYAVKELYSGNVIKEINKNIDAPFKNYKTVEVKIGVMYWRKANAIHNWFITNCADGIDECQNVYVSIEQLKQLRDLCKDVLDHSKLVYDKSDIKNEYIIEDPSYAMKNLPTASGFLFGSIEYNQDYYEDVKNTLECLDNILSINIKEFEDWYFIYKASW